MGPPARRWATPTPRSVNARRVTLATGSSAKTTRRTSGQRTLPARSRWPSRPTASSGFTHRAATSSPSSKHSLPSLQNLDPRHFCQQTPANTNNPLSSDIHHSFHVCSNLFDLVFISFGPVSLYYLIVNLSFLTTKDISVIFPTKDCESLY